MGILCLSEIPDNLLMWSHYANKHLGICLALDFQYDLALIKTPLKVNYPNNFSPINPIRERDKFKNYEYNFATKSKDWAYEKEIRLIRTSQIDGNYRGLVDFNPKILRSVILGYKTSLDDKCVKKVLKAISQEKYRHVNILKAYLKEKNFGLTFKSVPQK